MMELSIKEIVSATGAAFYGSKALLEEKIGGVTIDSRTVTPGCMFAALVGERTDGHRFIPMAFEKGAICVLAEHLPEETDGAVLLVEDVKAALQRAAEYYRSIFGLPIIGITGSVGKTTAKEMVAAVLGEKYRVHKTPANLNNELGVPLTLFGLRKEHTAAVIEMGISDFGEMSRLTRMVKPTYALFTTIGDAHLEFLGDRTGVLRAKSEILEYLAADGKVFVNGDDALLRTMNCAQQKVSFGTAADCDVRAEKIAVDALGNTHCVIVGQGRRFPVEIPAYGDHMLCAALEGAAVGMALGLSDEEIASGIAKYQTVGHRGRVIHTDKLTIIDDCYNANPTSVSSAIRSLTRLPGRHVCILGDMLELGSESKALHEQCGSYAVELGAALVLCCGEMGKHMARAAGAAGLHFESRETLIEQLPALLKTGDAVLVKASHSMKFEEIVAVLERLE